MQLKDKVVVITGAASGIGLGLARRFRAEGATVVAVDRAPDGQALAQAIGGRFIQADISVEEEVRRVVDNVLEHEGQIDLFCSNAGIAIFGGPELPQEAWDQVFRVNVMSHVWAARYALPHMLGRGSGHFLNVASAAGLITEFYSAPYAASKHASVGFSEWLAFTYKDQGIGVTLLCPEGVKTPIIADAPLLQMNAIEVEEVVEKTMQALDQQQFLVLTHATTQPHYQFKAAQPEAWMDRMVDTHRKVVQMQEATKHSTSTGT